MIRQSTLIAGAVAIVLGISLSFSSVMAHGHGGHGGGHGGGHDGGGHNHDHGHDHDHDHDHDNYRYDSDEFWSGPSVNTVVVYGNDNANADPCTDLNARLNYPGQCPDEY